MFGSRIGSRIGSVIGSSFGGDPLGGLMPFQTFDATSLKAVPLTAAEFINAGFAAPSHIWGCQEANGNLADSIGGKTLTAAGTPLYQQAIAGWTRKAVGANGAAASTFSNATMANLNASSVAFLVYTLFVTSAGSTTDRVFHGAASTNSLQSAVGVNIQRLRTGGNAANGALAHTGAVHPHVVVFDRTNSRNILYSDIEKVSVTFGASAGSTFELLTGLVADAAYNNQVLYAVDWEGAGAEMNDAQVKALLTAMGWAVSGY